MIIFDLEEIIFENFNISESNIICVKLTKVGTKVFEVKNSTTKCD